jgi:hypothetical protein
MRSYFMKAFMYGLLAAATTVVAGWWLKERTAQDGSAHPSVARTYDRSASADRRFVAQAGTIDPGMVITPRDTIDPGMIVTPKGEIDPKMIVTPPDQPPPPQRTPSDQ